MFVSSKVLISLHQNNYCVSVLSKQIVWRCYHRIPFIDLYQKTTGQTVSDIFLQRLKKKHPTIESLSDDRLQCSLQILTKFAISALEACCEPHVFCMNPITMDNYGEILKECGFVKITPKHIVRYHTLVKSRTIACLKKEGLIKDDINLEKMLQDCFLDWPASHKSIAVLPESSTSILTVRMSILQRYLNWKLSVTADEFEKYCRNYLPFKHKPMTDIQEALDLAQNEIKLNNSLIRRNGFILSLDPINTELIMKNVKSIAGIDIRDAIRVEPAILKNNYNALLQIREILEEYRISEDAQRRCLKVFCMCPATVKKRLDELRNLKEYQLLSTNPRVLFMVVHKKKMLSRLRKIQEANKQCFSLNHLVSSSAIFNNYINSLGKKNCSRDIAIMVSSSLYINNHVQNNETSQSEQVKTVLKLLRRHKYLLRVALNIIDENMQFLKKKFQDEVILNNCQLLLYPVLEVAKYIDLLLKLRNHEQKIIECSNTQLDASYNNLKYAMLTDDQILSLVLYEIEKKYHFSGDGIWANQDSTKLDVQSISA